MASDRPGPLVMMPQEGWPRTPRAQPKELVAFHRPSPNVGHHDSSGRMQLFDRSQAAEQPPGLRCIFLGSARSGEPHCAVGEVDGGHWCSLACWLVASCQAPAAGPRLLRSMSDLPSRRWFRWPTWRLRCVGSRYRRCGSLTNRVS